jgi:hypothetical protein
MCNFNFSLSPIKQVSFGIYDDQKTSLTGIIDNPDFAILVKKVFLRALALNYRDLFNTKTSPQMKYYKVLKSDVTQKEIETVTKYHDDAWLKHLQFDFKQFRFSHEYIPKV